MLLPVGAKKAEPNFPPLDPRTIMLSRKFRLSRHIDIMNVLRRGRRLNTPFVHLYHLAQPNAPTPRIACVVSKKVHSSAVKRHTYQRWLRRIAQDFISSTTASSDMVWVAKPKINTVKKISDLQKSLQPVLRRV